MQSIFRPSLAPRLNFTTALIFYSFIFYTRSVWRIIMKLKSCSVLSWHCIFLRPSFASFDVGRRHSAVCRQKTAIPCLWKAIYHCKILWNYRFSQKCSLLSCLIYYPAKKQAKYSKCMYLKNKCFIVTMKILLFTKHALAFL